MTIFHVYIKKRAKLDVDLKLVLLSCLRISAVIGDLELSQDAYTKVYYDSVIRDENNFQL